MIQPIALTSGDPAGIGIELAAKSWRALRDELAFFLIADRDQVQKILPNTPVFEITEPGLATDTMKQGLPLLHRKFPRIVEPGQSAMENAAAIIEVIEFSVSLVEMGAAGGICTNPVNKRILRQSAGFSFPGQTEFLAKLCQRQRAVMMLSSTALQVVPVTIHLALKHICDVLTIDSIIDTATITDRALRQDFGLKSPKIAVAGLNPHAGEEGEFGDEDQTLVQPAIQQLAQRGLKISGPYPSDSLFHDEARESYDVALCMYHDQALIPLKTLDFYGAVNVTLGLPIVRTSPDHGTGFDIAGKGMAKAESLINALRMARDIANRRKG